MSVIGRYHDANGRYLTAFVWSKIVVITRSSSLCHRYFFACTFLLVVVSSMYFISMVWIKWSASPVIITLSSGSKSADEFPFPGMQWISFSVFITYSVFTPFLILLHAAITICNMNVARKSVVQKIPKNTSDYVIVQSLCSAGASNSGSNSTSETWSFFRQVLMDVSSFLRKSYDGSLEENSYANFPFKVSPNCDDMIMYCEFGLTSFNCSTKFRKILTDDGLCCIFNGIYKLVYGNFSKINRMYWKATKFTIKLIGRIWRSWILRWPSEWMDARDRI